MFDLSSRIRVTADTNDNRYDGDSVWAKVERVDAPFAGMSSTMPLDSQVNAASRSNAGAEKSETLLGFVQGLFRRAA